MPSTLQRHRSIAFARQAGLCCYCHFPMLPAGTAGPLASLGCTAEHLDARCDGGGHAGNIAAAHRLCNERRHHFKPAPPPEKYRQIVELQVAGGYWFKAKTLARLIDLSAA